MKINPISQNLISFNSKFDLKNNQTTIYPSNSLKSDVFVSSKNINFGKRKKEIAIQEPNLAEKLKAIYRERNFDETGKISSIFKYIQTKEEHEFLSNYVDKSKNQLTHKVLENLVSEFDTFRKQNKRSMNEKELKILDTLMSGMAYRTEYCNLSYNGDVLCELVRLPQNAQEEKDIVRLLENNFALYDYDRGWGFLFSTNPTEENLGKGIGKLIRYKRENPEFADLIIPIATKYTKRGQGFSQVKEFFEFYKSEGKIPEIIVLGMNPNFDLQQAKYFYKEYLTKKSPLYDSVKGCLQHEPYEFFKCMTEAVKKYPDLIDEIKTNLKLSDFKELYKAVSYDEIEASRIYLHQVRKLTENNPKIDFMTNLVSSNGFIDWQKVIPQNCSKEEANKRIEIIYEALAPVQRLDSRQETYNSDWAMRNKTLIDITSREIQDGVGFDEVLNDIAQNYRTIFSYDEGKHRGVRRTTGASYTPYAIGNYSEYKTRYDSLVGVDRVPAYPDISATRFVDDVDRNLGEIIHPNAKEIDNFLAHAKDNYEKIMQIVKKKSLGNVLTQTDRKILDENASEIQFLLSTAQPYKRGSAGITNILVRSLYKAVGIILPPVKRNVGLDLEAFCTSLKDYKINWRTFFEIVKF